MRHNRLLAMVLAVAGVITLTLSAAQAPPASGTPDGMLFGAYTGPRTGESDRAAVLRGEATAGREFDVVREFLSWDSAFPDSFHTWLRDTGRTMLLSVKSRRANGQTIRWQSIIDAQPGSALYGDIERWADRIRSYGVPIYFTFNHEPESGASSDMGEAPQFIAAWRKIHGIFQQRGVTNAKFMWIMTDYAFWVGSQARNHGPDWFPGEDYMDAMGIDAYNWFTCRTGINTAWKPLEQIVRPFRDFGAQYPDEELWLTEWAGTEDPARPGRKAQWYAEAQALFKRSDYAQFHGISYFDTRGQGVCQWFPDSSESAAAAFRALGTDPFYGGAGVPPPPPDPEPSDISFVASASSNGNRTTHSVQVPASVRPGDTLLLFFTANTNVTVTPPPGWTAVQSADPALARARVWVRTAGTRRRRVDRHRAALRHRQGRRHRRGLPQRGRLPRRRERPRRADGHHQPVRRTVGHPDPAGRVGGRLLGGQVLLEHRPRDPCHAHPPPDHDGQRRRPHHRHRRRHRHHRRPGPDRHVPRHRERRLQPRDRRDARAAGGLAGSRPAVEPGRLSRYGRRTSRSRPRPSRRWGCRRRRRPRGRRGASCRRCRAGAAAG